MGEPDDPSNAAPRARLLLSNVVKDHNLGALLRTADAFGVEEVVIVGRRRIARAGTLSVGMAKFLRRTSFPNLDDAVAHLRGRGCEIVGAEVDPDATPIDEFEFSGPTAFVLGNEGDGLSPRQRRHCDRLVRIRQYGHTASLNVHVAGAIVLHRFALWAGLEERRIVGTKYEPLTDHAHVPAGHERRRNQRPGSTSS